MPKTQHRSARFAATETLCLLYRDKMPVKPLFTKIVNSCHLASKDRNLTMQLVYGVLRNRQTLDMMLAALSRTPLHKLDPFVHQTLAVGLYQLFFLERIPQAAAVNEAVVACKQAKIPKRLHGFVNGVLRQAIRQQKKNLLPALATHADGSPILNHPDWLIARWQKEFGRREAERICRANNREPLLVLRVNSSRLTRDELLLLFQQAEISCRAGEYSEEALVLDEFRGPVTTLPGYSDGFFQVQDEAPQLATLLLGPFRQRGCYVDACAGLGGKTSHLLEFGARHNLQIHAFEPDPYRLDKLHENISRLFADYAPVVHAGKFQHVSAEALPRVDGILVDAPCSGTGVTGRHPDIRWNRVPGDFIRYRRQQINLLDHAAALLPPHGILVYATCSLEPEENRLVVADFLAAHRNFVLTDCTPLLPKQAHRFIENSFFAPRPARTIDGFFAARMQRT
ncbi:MAG: 16S rRNA (cytosine(967)-C(5))-methyltransferase RsmB [Desulforhopalus sp.]